MTDTKKWKSRLLSSSIPLEYEVAKILADLKFSVSFDYTYFRKEGDQKKEFSADINGFCLFPLDNQDQVDASLTILAECKYREEGKKWVFLPDVGTEFSSASTVGNTIKSLAEFSQIKNNKKVIYKFEERLHYALKGVEINMTTGEVFDKDIRHGISQLKFALPYFIKSDIERNAYGHLVDAIPHYYLSILITNADLYILNDNFSTSEIKKAEELEEFATKVPYLVCCSTIGPDFTDHHKEIFADLTNYSKYKNNLPEFEAFQIKLKDRKYGLYNSPIGTCSDLAESSSYILNKYYSQHIVCTSDHFDKLIQEIQKVLTIATIAKPRK